MKKQNLITAIITNEDGLCKGNLVHYFNVMLNAPNVRLPYHNFRHMTHILCRVYEGIKYYLAKPGKTLINQDEVAALLIAALFHDYGHSGKKISADNPDSKNIERALEGFRKNILPEDIHIQSLVETLIQATEFPHVKNIEHENMLLVQIMRDADVLPVLHPVWLQEIIFGLSQEMEITPQELLALQEGFLKFLSANLTTEWAQKTYVDSGIIENKITEVREFIQIIH